jgi:hypothetical protein
LNHFTVPCVICFSFRDSGPRHADRQPNDQTATSGLPCKEKETPAPSFCASVCITRTLRISTWSILRDPLTILLRASGVRGSDSDPAWLDPATNGSAIVRAARQYLVTALEVGRHQMHIDGRLGRQPDISLLAGLAIVDSTLAGVAAPPSMLTLAHSPPCAWPMPTIWSPLTCSTPLR